MSKQGPTLDMEYRYGFSDPEQYVYKSRKGLDRQVVEEISAIKGEPDWMRRFRLKALQIFESKPMPGWGGDLSRLRFDDIYYYIRPTDRQGRSWDEVPETIKKTFDRLGIPEAERKFLAGVTAQYESEVIYHSIRKELERQGVIFVDTDTAVRQYPDLVREHFGTVVPPADNKFAALNSAVWSGGSFIWVPEGVKVEIPLQAYFRINARNMGQFERTLIIAEPGSFVHYVEGCTAPQYTTDSLHSAVVEIIVKPGARVRYTTIQNWSHNVYNLVTKRAAVYADATMEWVDGNIGCLTADTQVLLNPRGPVPIKDVRPGDYVYAVDPQGLRTAPHRVNGVTFTGVRPVFRLATEDHRAIRATANHPFLALAPGSEGRAWRLGWRPLEQLRPGDLIAVADAPPGARSPYPGPAGVEFVRVRSIEPLGEEPVYDIEVEGAHNFVANGLVVHNSKLTMKYPSVYLLEKGARGEVLSVAFAGPGQHQDAGAKAVHYAPYTTSVITNKSVCKDGGRTTYRGLVHVADEAFKSKSKVNCDALIFDDRSRTDTIPYIEVLNSDVQMEHEATVSKVSEEQLFYLMSRGIPQEQATSMIVMGFIEPFTRQLPMEYAVELNRLIELEMEGSVG